MNIVEKNQNFISLRVIIDRVMTFPGMEDLPEDVTILTIVDLIRLIGNSDFLWNTDYYVSIEEYRGELPDNVVNIKKVVKVNSDESRSSSTINNDPFFASYNGRNFREGEEVKYNIRGQYIFTNFEEGKLHIAYQAIPTDFDGMVMVPDNASVIKAVEYSLIEAWFTRKMLAGKITRDKVDWASRERNWYVAQSGASTSQHNLDQRQTLANIATTLFTNNNHHDTDYMGLGSSERRRVF